MELWELTSAKSNDFATLVFSNKDELWSGMFDMDGQPKHWVTRPSIQPFIEKRKKKQKPIADISYLTHGTLILNSKANAVLGDFVLKYGQLLEIDCLGEIYFFLNITNLIPVIDIENSEKSASGQSILKPVFLPTAIPETAQIFKDPRTAGGVIYATNAAKVAFEKLKNDAQLTGASFYKAGTDLTEM